MPEFDVIIRGGQVVTSDAVIAADIAVSDGQIVALEPDLAGNSRDEIDASGLHVFPGLIDAHVHFNEPGRTEWEGWATGSHALAAGGGTTACEMPLNAHPPTLDRASFELKLAAAQDASLTDFAFWGGLVPGNREHMPELAAAGVIGFKAFMSTTGTSDFTAADDLTLYEGMEQAAQLGLPVAVHAESDTITKGLAARAIAAGRTSAGDYLASRPVIAEVEAIARAITLAEATGCSLHIVHVSTGRGVELVVAARARGVDVTAETCPHYLLFTGEDLERLGSSAKCSPPLRDLAEQAALWEHLAAGNLAMATSDHSPAPASMKSGDNFFQMWGGIAGIQSTLPALLSDGYHQRGLPLPLIANVTASAVARRFRLPGKGAIVPGADADLALVRLDHEWQLSAADLLDRNKLSPYAGRRFQGQIDRTLLRGETIFHNGKADATPRGRLIKPDPLTSPA